MGIDGMCLAIRAELWFSAKHGKQTGAKAGFESGDLLVDRPASSIRMAVSASLASDSLGKASDGPFRQSGEASCISGHQ
jgi:hypothetical protein